MRIKMLRRSVPGGPNQGSELCSVLSKNRMQSPAWGPAALSFQK